MIKSANYQVNLKLTNNKELEDLFDYVNSHLTVMESAVIKYKTKNYLESEKIKLPQPVKKSNQEYLTKFMPPVKKITTSLIGQSCPICLEYFLGGEEYRQLICNHNFHLQCIDQWAVNDLDELSCPICRKSQYKDNVDR